MKSNSQNPLISVIITSYNNFRFIYECLDSIVNQTYENIEIIICDDGSYDFLRTGLDYWFKLYAKDNIKNIIINQNENNLGTVKNVNVGLKCATGDIITMIAADDKYASHDVFSHMIHQFRLLPEDALVLTSQVAMCNEWMQIEYHFMNERVQDVLNYGSVRDLLKLEMIGSLLPACGTFYKRLIFDQFGLCDESYDLIEDYVLHLKILRNGVRFYYINEVTVLHRKGGVSHSVDKRATNLRFFQDCMNVYDREVLPYIDDLLSKEEKEEVLQVYSDTKDVYLYALEKKTRVFDIIKSRKARFHNYAFRMYWFFAPRFKTISRYLAVVAFTLCVIPQLFESKLLPMDLSAINTPMLPLSGGIMFLFITAVNIAFYILKLILDYHDQRQNLLKFPISRFLEAL